jgi:hypothetical protein
MWSSAFWKDAAERAIRTAAQAILAMWGTQVTGIMQVDLVQTASVAAFAAVASLLMSIVAGGVGDHESASVIGPRVDVVASTPEIEIEGGA